MKRRCQIDQQRAVQEFQQLAREDRYARYPVAPEDGLQLSSTAGIVVSFAKLQRALFCSCRGKNTECAREWRSRDRC